jgi:hypothetical protein
MPAAANPPLPARRAGVPSLAARGFYIALIALMSGVVLLGFWPFYAGLVSGAAQVHWLIYVHAAVFSGWMALLLAQALLVFRRRVGTHQRLGRLGIAYGSLVLVLGVVISIAAPAMNVLAGRTSLDEAAAFLILPTVDMLLFAGFFAAAITYRRRKELHKRLILLATISLLFAPAARIGFAGGPLAILLIWLLPLFLAMGYDLATRRRVERVYFVGLAVFLVAVARIGLMETQAWRDIGRGILLLVLPEGTT